jgi:Domain of unknown function (DUF4126)
MGNVLSVGNVLSLGNVLSVGNVLSLNMLIEVLLAISLSAAAGFRVFVPLLVVSAAAVMGHFDLPAQLDWAETPQALAMLGVACVLEVGGYYIPWFDHALDLVSTPAAMIVGTLIAAAVAPDLNPIAQWGLAIAAGGGTAGLTKGLSNILRLTSTAISGGLTNPLWATIELVAAIAISVLAITVPFVAGILVIGILGIAIYKIGQFLITRLGRRKPSAPQTNQSS